ncbi:MAG: permease-like cell division protein FtsX [Nitrospirota bacterium]
MALYAFRLAAQSILHEKWINLLSLLTITTCLLIIALTGLSVYNVDLFTKKLPEKFFMILYLKDNLSEEESKNIIDFLKKDGAVDTVKIVSKDEAMKELKVTLKDSAYILEGLDENPLRDSVEIKLRKDSVGPETAKRLSAALRKMQGVDEVAYGEEFLSSIYSIKVGLKAISILFILVMLGGVIFVCYSAVKILFYRKNEEIETYKLLGATKKFVRAPFIIEGAVIGFCGGLLGLIGILFLYYVVILQLSITIPLLSAIIFPANLSFLLPIAGLLLGMTGGAIAIGRIRY